MIEEWKDIEEFPRYAVSNMGRVMYLPAERIKKASVNQTNMHNVLLTDEDHKQYRRGLAKLVATYFLPRESGKDHFDTPINLDGDRGNCDVRNLAWRPYWFACKYHAQFAGPMPHGYTGPVADITTGVEYSSIRVAAQALGLLEHEIFLSTQSRILVFPTWNQFALVAG